MKIISRLLVACFALISLALASPVRADAEKRIALVVGNAAYQAGALATPANDAGLIAQTLQAAGFDVSGARDLDGETLRGALRDFLDKAQASGPDTVAFIYLGGYGAQLDGDNYFMPVDAKIAAVQDVAIEAVRISDYTKRLAGLPLKASFVVLDAARASPFGNSGQPLAGGLALVDPDPNMLIAFNAAPGTVAPAENGSYGAYAQALAEMIREGGLSPADVFDGVRLRVNEVTKGGQVPWDVSRISAPFVFFERAADAPPPALAQDKASAMRSRPLQDLGAQDAYAAAIERDTLEGYEEFLAAYPSDPLANRIRGLVAARREAMTWRHTRVVNTPDAYWSYLDRYPRGPHAADAHRRLASLTAPAEPPASFAPISYDIPPPPPAEIVYVDRPVLVFSDPVFGFVPPPPIVFLAPPPPYLVFLPPPPPIGLFVLPVPAFVPFPVWINSPAYVAPPPENVFFNNIHNTTIINNNNTVINPGGAHGRLPPAVAGAGAGVAAAAMAAKVALPPSVARKATMIGGSGIPAKPPGQPAPGAPLGRPGALPPAASPSGQALPGANGKPLPGPNAKPGAHALPGADGKPLPGPNEKPGAGAGGKPGGVPPKGAPDEHALPGAGGKPGGLLPKGAPDEHALPGASGKPGGLPPKGAPGEHALPGASGKPGGLPPKGAPGEHALPSGQQLPPLQGKKSSGGAKPVRTPSPEALPPAGKQPTAKPPAGELPSKRRHAPSGPNGKAAAPEPSPTMAPKPQGSEQPPQQNQHRRQPQPADRPPHQPQQQQWHQPQQQQWRQPQQQQWHQPQQQQWHQPQQQQWHQPQPSYQQPRGQQQQHGCGQPGMPPCH